MPRAFSFLFLFSFFFLPNDALALSRTIRFPRSSRTLGAGMTMDAVASGAISAPSLFFPLLFLPSLAKGRDAVSRCGGTSMARREHERKPLNPFFFLFFSFFPFFCHRRPWVFSRIRHPAPIFEGRRVVRLDTLSFFFFSLPLFLPRPSLRGEKRRSPSRAARTVFQSAPDCFASLAPSFFLPSLHK